MLQKCKYSAFILLFLLIREVSSENDIQTNLMLSQKNIKCKSGQNWTFYGKLSSGILDRNLYLENGTFEQVLFFSDYPFSITVEGETSLLSLTGSSFSKEIRNQQEAKIRINQKSYEVWRKKSIGQKDQNNIKHQQRRHFANLSIYGACKSTKFSSQFKQIDIMITFYPQRESRQVQNIQSKQLQSTEQKSKQFEKIYGVKLNIGATLYCVDSKQVKQWNFAINKLYELLIIFLFGTVLNFSVLKNIPRQIRVLALISWVVGIHWIQIWLIALLSSYSIIILVILLKMVFQPFFQLTSNDRQKIRKRTLYAMFMVIPIFSRSFLDEINNQGWLLSHYVGNIVILCSALLFTQSIIYIQRFRHAFYYFIVFVLTELFFKKHFQSLLVSTLLQIKIFAVPPQSISLFFTIMLVPLCNFFFYSSTSEHVIKFFILLVPVISLPYQISCSASFSIGFILWIINQGVKGRDLTKIIKQKK